ncbi:MAG: alpha/beta hydrolase [Magnetococcales bacterium]|nr:alpha/beta hydrolase [Magnetococcales bacterium]NGZ06502.1 alpha/beta hydrolase [Magnetococcales bacterium]
MLRLRPEGRLLLSSGFLLCTLAACAGFWSSPTERLLALAAQHQLQKITLSAGPFQLTGFLRNPETEVRILRIYLEGDGLAWSNRTTLSPDPTPTDSPVLTMMIRDPAPTALYLSRPCQLVGGITAGCPPQYWSTHRYAPEVVTAISTAIDQIKQQVDAQQIGLIGYSGGGVIAALLAANRQDVAWWITIAANLDLETWTRHHGVSPMPESLNPTQVIDRLASTHQIHFMGGRDQQVPETVTRAYLNRLPATTPLQTHLVPEFDHACCWADHWLELLTRLQLP